MPENTVTLITNSLRKHRWVLSVSESHFINIHKERCSMNVIKGGEEEQGGCQKDGYWVAARVGTSRHRKCSRLSVRCSQERWRERTWVNSGCGYHGYHGGYLVLKVTWQYRTLLWHHQLVFPQIVFSVFQDEASTFYITLFNSSNRIWGHLLKYFYSAWAFEYFLFLLH